MPRNFLIQIKVSEQEKAQVKADATRMKQNVSEYARSLLLHEKSEIPDAAPTVAPDKPLPPRQTEADEVDAFKQSPEQEYERRVNRHALRMPRRKAEAIVKKEMGLDG